MGLEYLFLTVSLQFGLPQDLLASVCFIETRHNVRAIHYDDGKGDSLGVCQIKLSSARLVGFRGTDEELMKPKTNIYYAGALLAHQLHRYNGSINKAVIAYNIGHAGHLTSTKYQVKVFREWRLRNEYADRD